MSATLDLPAPTGLQPREYQDDAVQAVVTKHTEEGVKRLLGVAATGLGKTIVFSQLALRMGVPTIILAHRDELIQQAAEKLRMVWPDAPIGIVKAERNEHNMPVVVGSVQTLSRKSRLDQVDPSFGLVIVDEAHHATAESYIRVLRHLRCLPDEFTGEEHPEQPLLFGVTATPDRGDKVGLSAVFDEVAFKYDMRWGIKNNYLADLKAKEVMLRLNLDAVKQTHGDYQDGALGQALTAADAPEHVYKAWALHASDRKTLGFTPTVATAAEFAAYFQSQGVTAAYVSGETPIDERRQILADFAAGRVQCLFNCAVLTEGYDEPSIRCIIMARPTKSRGFYQQMVGRGTRKYPGKHDCLILDVVGVAKRHSLATTASLLGLDPEKMEQGMSARQGIAVQDNPPEAPKGDLVVEDVDLWKQFEDADLAWVPTAKGTFAVSVMGAVVTLQPVGAGWGVVITRKDGRRTILSSTKAGLPVEVAQGVAEDYVRTVHGHDNGTMADKNASWRKKPASEGQIAALHKWKVLVAPGMTAGEASDILTAKIASAKGR